jgi:phosphate-selective porin OprO/OprP
MTFKRKIIPALIISGSLFAASGSASANDSAELEKLRALVQELDQKIRVIDRKNELAEEAAAAKKKEAPVVKASQDGFGIESGDGQHKIKFGGLIQGDYRYFNSGRGNAGSAANIATEASDSAIARRAEPIIQATLFDKYDFVYVGEFGSNNGANSNTIVDVFARARFSPAFTVQAGKHQVPLRKP